MTRADGLLAFSAGALCGAVVAAFICIAMLLTVMPPDYRVPCSLEQKIGR